MCGTNLAISSSHIIGDILITVSTESFHGSAKSMRRESNHECKIVLEARDLQLDSGNQKRNISTWCLLERKPLGIVWEAAHQYPIHEDHQLKQWTQIVSENLFINGKRESRINTSFKFRPCFI